MTTDLNITEALDCFAAVNILNEIYVTTKASTFDCMLKKDIQTL